MRFGLGAMRTLAIACSVIGILIVQASAKTVSSTVLVFARDAAESTSATSGLLAYQIPHRLVIVPSSGITLPTLNSSAAVGNYGGIIIMGDVAYDYGGSVGYTSALVCLEWGYSSPLSCHFRKSDLRPCSPPDTFFL